VQRAPTAVVDMSPSSESCRSMPRPYAGPSPHSVADVGWHRKGFPSSVLPHPIRLGLREDPPRPGVVDVPHNCVRGAVDLRGHLSDRARHCLRTPLTRLVIRRCPPADRSQREPPRRQERLEVDEGAAFDRQPPSCRDDGERPRRVGLASLKYCCPVLHGVARWRTTPTGRTRRTSPCTPPIGSRASLRNDRRESGPDGSPVVHRWWVSPGWVRAGGRALGILARRVTDPERRSDKAATHGTTSADRRPHRGADRPA